MKFEGKIPLYLKDKRDRQNQVMIDPAIFSLYLNTSPSQWQKRGYLQPNKCQINLKKKKKIKI